jgi:branched-chain amino acid transport system ATP-binding protein
MLEVHKLQAWYGSAQALFDISLQVGTGELVVLQGLNGAGKSTLLKSVMGLVPAVHGTIRYHGESIEKLPAHQRALQGLGYVPEDRRLFSELTVLENLRIASRARVSHDGADGVGESAQQRQDRVLEIFPPLQKMLSRRSSHMSGGEQQMLSIARTLMGSPQLLLLDEPCEGIAPVLVDAIREALLLLAKQGMTMLIAEQNELLAAHANRVITLVAGHTTTAVEP